MPGNGGALKGSATAKGASIDLFPRLKDSVLGLRRKIGAGWG